MENLSSPAGFSSVSKKPDVAEGKLVLFLDINEHTQHYMWVAIFL